MATAPFRASQQQQRAASVQDHRPFITEDTSRSASHPYPRRRYGHVGSRQEEKEILAQQYDAASDGEPLPWGQMLRDSTKNQLGFSAQKLRVTDFELMKTLGTGTTHTTCSNVGAGMKKPQLTDLHSGTFARVWLARFENPRLEDRNKIYALKVLRKVDG